MVANLEINALESTIKAQLDERREKLVTTITKSQNVAELQNLLREVDAALERIAKSSYGICEVCHDKIETERLIIDPLVRFCIHHLSPKQQSALEQDLNLAREMQSALLPQQCVVSGGWEIYRHYEPLGPVGGDYCDLVLPADENGEVFFLLGDVSGKGIASAMLVNQLHATFRSLVTTNLSVCELVERANRIFCEGTMPAYYATLLCGKANSQGDVEICNAGHCPPLLFRNGKVEDLSATGMPIGLFYGGHFTSHSFRLNSGDSLFLYTDGLSEAKNQQDAEYGTERLAQAICSLHDSPPQKLASACLDGLRAFQGNALKMDDLSIMVLKRI